MASVSLVLKKQHARKDGTLQLSLRIIKDRKTRYEGLRLYLNPSDWDEVKQCPRKKHRAYYELAAYCEKIKSDAARLILDLNSQGKAYSANDLIARLNLNNRHSSSTLYGFFQLSIENKLSNNQIGNANIFKSCFNRIKAFTDGQDKRLDELTPLFVQEFETWIKRGGVKENTVFVYLRTFKTLLNEAKRLEIVPENYNPFKAISFERYRRIKTKKRALSEAEFEALKNYRPIPNTYNELAYDVFMFSFYARGINFIDIANLKWSDVKDDRLSYKRKKTHELQNMKLHPVLMSMLIKLEGLKENEDGCVFPILNETHLTPVQIDSRIDKVLKRINGELKKIGQELKFKEPLTTYVARHSFATLSAKRGIPVADISKAMGHQSTKVTQVYLDSFEDKRLDEIFDQL
ncbi:MAG: phage integrase SAM-like domain-containing protein [Bacteroidota bacterium]